MRSPRFSRSQMALAVLFTAVSFAALGMFDVLAVTAVAPGAVTYRVAAAAGALGHAVSNVLGFGVLTGGALRYRIYSAEGLDAASVLRVIGTLVPRAGLRLHDAARADPDHRPRRGGPASLARTKRRRHPRSGDPRLDRGVPRLDGNGLAHDRVSRLVGRPPRPARGGRPDRRRLRRHRGLRHRPLRAPARRPHDQPPALSRHLWRRHPARHCEPRSRRARRLRRDDHRRPGADPQGRGHRGAHRLPPDLLRPALRARRGGACRLRGKL